MTATAELVQRLARRGVLATWVLLGLCLVAAALLSPASPASALVTISLFIPWLLPLRGLMRGDRRTHAWATLCVAPYFVYGVTETVANPAVRVAAAAILFASLAHFVALVVYLRATRPQTRPQGEPSP